MGNPGEKFSFSLLSKPRFPSSSSTPQHNILLSQEIEETHDDEQNQSLPPPPPHYITEYDPSQTLITPNPHFLIPPMTNTLKSSENPPSDPHHRSSPPPSDSLELEDPSLKKLRDDLKNLPDHRGLLEFIEMPVESFGYWYLATYGRSEGKGIGRNSKEDVEVRQYPRRGGREGLGFIDPAPGRND